MRIVAWNIENLAPRLGELPALAQRFGADVLCLQEIRVRPQDADLIAQMHAALPGYTCHASLNRDARNATYRGGRAYGVATYVAAHLGPVATEVPAWDLEGRIVFVAVAGVAIGNVYAVNGTDKPYWDHELGRIEGDRHAFKRRFQERVLARAHELRGSGAGVVVTGDWNVSQTALDTTPRLRTSEPHVKARAELAAHMQRTGMVDIYRRLHPEQRGYTWRNRRARGLDAARVDFALVSEDLVPRVTAAEILDDRAGSDHAPVAVDLNVTTRTSR